MGHLGAEELWCVQRGLVDHYGHALSLHAFQDALDGACAEVFEAGRCQAARALDRSFSIVDATTNIYVFCLIRLNSSVSSNSDIAH